MVKKIIVVFLAVSQLVLLSGCWNYVEIDQQINVAGIALDIGDQGKRYHLSAEVVSAGMGEKSQLETHIMETEGDTVFESIRGLMAISSKKLYFGHCKLMVIGEDLAKYGIREILDLPLRNHELITSMDIVVSKDCTGKEILQTKGITTAIVSYRICDMLKTCAEKNGCVGIEKDYLVYDGLETKGMCLTIPAVEKQKLESEDVVKMGGASVFNGDRLVGHLNDKEVNELSLMTNSYKSGLITTESVESPYYSTSFEVYKSRTSMKVSCGADGAVVADVLVKSWVNIGEVQTRANFLDEAETEKTRQSLEKSIEYNLRHIVQVAQETYRCDLFGVGRKIEKQNPAAWKSLGLDWKKRFPKVKIQIKSEVIIMSSGVSSVAKS